VDGAAVEFEGPRGGSSGGRGDGDGVEDVGCAGCVAEEVLEREGDEREEGGWGVEWEEVIEGGVEVDGCGDRLDVLEGEARGGAEVD
jgi:hypothetical protein